MAQLVEVGTLTTALNAVDCDESEANLTSAAIEVVHDEYVRIAYDLTGLDGTGMAAADTIAVKVLGSFDGGTTYRLIDFVKSDQTMEDLGPNRALVSGDIAATFLKRDLGSVDVSGLDHIKVRAVPGGTPDADNKISVYVKSWRE